MSDALEDIVVAELDRLGFDLVELRRGGTRSRPVVEVRLDRRDDERVSIDDCARVSRALEARLDAGGIVPEQYVLEVSSAGVERPLKRVADWRRFVGREASVNSPALNGRQTVEIVGVEGEAGSEAVVVRTGRGEEQRVPLADIKDARLVFNWKR